MHVNSIQSLNIKNLDPETDVIVVGIDFKDLPLNVRRRMINDYQKQFKQILPEYKIIVLETGEHPPSIQPTTHVELNETEYDRITTPLCTDEAIATVATNDKDEKLVDDIVNSVDEVLQNVTEIKKES